MKRLILVFILFPFLTFSQAPKKYPTLLWKISGKGMKKPSYLYGTMHVSNRVAYYLSEQFFEALKSVDVVGLETNPGEWLENMEKTGELEELSQLRSSDFYNTDFYRNTFTATFPEKRMLQGILSYDPDIINGLLYRQNKAKENFEEITYIDLFIYQSASKLGKQLISLENFAQSEIKARLSAIPDADPEESATRNYTGTQSIEDAYREGNLDKLDSLSKIGSSKNTQRYLINDRNVFFVNTIDSVLKTKSLFSGVGAAHLPGENGVIELLRKKGYTVEPLTPKVSKKSNAIREELDLQIKPVVFQKQIISDSVFSVSLPGKLYPIVDIGHLKYYIYADMVNGSFYTVVRLRHLGPIFNMTPEALMQRTDSLLFENVPGKIILKKEIVSNSGARGIEIINQTRRGDQQHYQIFFTELEMIMFKLGGKHDYASSNESKQFFNSIQFISKSEKSVSFSPNTKGFNVNLPANYSHTKHTGSSVAGPVEDLYAYSKSKKQFYGVQQAVYNDFNYLEEDTFELNQFAKNILRNYKFKEAITYETRKEQGFPCIRFNAKNKIGTNFYGKLYIKGVHYYLVYFISESESSFDNDFFTSFKLSDFEYVNPIKEITDKDFYFKAKDEVTDNALSRFNESYSKAFEATVVKKDSVKKKDYDFRTGNKFYYSPSSNEYVNISFEKYNDYDYRDKSEIDEKIAKVFTSTTSMFISNKKSNFKDGLYTYTCSLRDTATSRAIAVKVFIRNGLMQELSAPYDTTIGLKGWTKEFMESFSPIDSIVGKNIFENKFKNLLNDLCSNDTVVRQMANTSVNSIGFQKAFGDDYVQFISTPKIDLVNEDSRAQLFVNGGTLKNEKIIQPYKDLYKHYTDSFYLQLCLLKGLAYLKTQSAYTEFYNLLINETPLVGAGNTVSDVFYVLHDSLELCKKFFPGMLALTKYDEYREAVYCLMADLVNKKIITPASYALQKENILIDANLALKRYNPLATKAPASYEQGSFDFLERTAKDLAESIKGSLDGLANNNYYKGSSYLRSLESYNRSPLVNYAWLLSPFYKTDEKTKQFFAKISKIKTQTIAMPVAIDLLKQNIILNDTLVSYYCKNKFTRAYFYSELEKEKLTDKFDKRYLNQQSLIESVVMSHKQLTNFYNYEKDKFKKDSLILIKEVNAGNKYQKGTLYIYKSAKGKNDEEQWCAVFIDHSKEAINSKIELVQSNYFIDNTKSEQENINELLNAFTLTYRKRAQVSTGSYE